MSKFTSEVLSVVGHKWLPMACRFLCLCVVIYQCIIFDYYLVVFSDWHEVVPDVVNGTSTGAVQIEFVQDLTRCAWAAADIVVLVIFIAAFVKSHQYFQAPRNGAEKQKLGQLPLGYITWGVYAAVTAAKIVVLFTRTAQVLDEKAFFGPNLLKTTIAVSTIVFLTLVMTHHDAEAGSPRQGFIDFLTASITMDLLDTTDFLSVLFIQKSKTFLSFSMHHAILAFTCINLLLPTVPLVVLSLTRFGEKGTESKFKLLHKVLYVLMVNMPFFAIRQMLWHLHDHDISVFMIKNVLSLGLMIRAVQHGFSDLAIEDEKRRNANSNLEMAELNISGSNSPSTGRDGTHSPAT